LQKLLQRVLARANIETSFYKGYTLRNFGKIFFARHVIFSNFFLMGLAYILFPYFLYMIFSTRKNSFSPYGLIGFIFLPTILFHLMFWNAVVIHKFYTFSFNLFFVIIPAVFISPWLKRIFFKNRLSFYALSLMIMIFVLFASFQSFCRLQMVSLKSGKLRFRKSYQRIKEIVVPQLHFMRAQTKPEQAVATNHQLSLGLKAQLHRETFDNINRIEKFSEIIDRPGLSFFYFQSRWPLKAGENDLYEYLSERYPIAHSLIDSDKNYFFVFDLSAVPAD
jgi:hypothetical protein